MLANSGATVQPGERKSGFPRLTRRTNLGEDRPTVNELIRRPLLASALAAIAIGLVGAPSAGAQD